MTDYNSLLFFLGANSAGGFVSKFHSVYDPSEDWKVYIIKGGPGTGKSTFMKNIAAVMEAEGQTVHLFPCSSDPLSLDGVVFPDMKVYIADGTAPHVMEPQYVGLCESIVNVGDCIDTDYLTTYKDILMELYKENAALHERASRYIAAAGSLMSDGYRIAMDCTDTTKASRFAMTLARREFKAKSGRKGREDIRFLSGVTPLGYLFYEDTIHELCDRVLVVEDEYGASSRIIMSVLRAAALEYGLDIVTCYCPLSADEKIDHILIPSLSLAICTENRYLKPQNADRCYHARRFTDNVKLRQKKQRLSFNRKAARELLQNASDILAEAKLVHDQIEKFYVASMDFGKLERMQEKLIRDIKKRAASYH